MLVGLKRISTAFGILAATGAAASAQGIALTANQTTADAVAASLRQSPALSGYRIEIESVKGAVTLSGSVSTPSQRAEAIARARSIPGVSKVADHLVVSSEVRVQRVQYQTAFGGHGGHGGGNVIYDGGTGASMGAAGGVATGAPIGGGPIGGPLPEGPAIPGAGAAGQPGQPNYAWPSYAPYPNFSAVGYPTAYPWQAWPNIGPPSPYPEVPLDWRAVTLRWDDGIWWLDFKKHYTRPFFTPYPFGIFAY
jgi:BON domain